MTSVPPRRPTLPPAAEDIPLVMTGLLVKAAGKKYNTAATAAARPDARGGGRPGNKKTPSWIAAPTVEPRGRHKHLTSAPPRPLPSVRGDQASSSPPRPLDTAAAAAARPNYLGGGRPGRHIDNGTPPVPR